MLLRQPHHITGRERGERFRHRSILPGRISRGINHEFRAGLGLIIAVLTGLIIGLIAQHAKHRYCDRMSAAIRAERRAPHTGQMASPQILRRHRIGGQQLRLRRKRRRSKRNQGGHQSNYGKKRFHHVVVRPSCQG